VTNRKFQRLVQAQARLSDALGTVEAGKTQHPLVGRDDGDAGDGWRLVYCPQHIR